MLTMDGECQNRLNFRTKNNCDLNFKCGTRSFSVDFFGKRRDNKSHGNNDKFIADRHANVGIFFNNMHRVLLVWTRRAVETTFFNF